MDEDNNDELPLVHILNDPYSSDSTDPANDPEPNTEPSLSAAEITFDLSLPGAHKYLGNDMEDLSGRTVLNCDSTEDLPLFIKSDLILVPGQTLPIIVYYPWEADTLLKAKTTNKTVGYICYGSANERLGSMDDLIGAIGTTGELVSIKEDNVEDDGFTVIHAVIVGRQRFRTVEVRQHLNSVFRGKVKILKESSQFDLEHPLDNLVPSSWQRYCVSNPTPPQTLDSSHSLIHVPLDPNLPVSESATLPTVLSLFEHSSASHWGSDDPSRPGRPVEVTTGGVDRSGTPFRYIIRRPEKLPHIPRERDMRICVASAFTHVPPWIYRQYDLAYLIDSIRNELKQWNDTWDLSHWTPDMAVKFSYWLIQNLPVPNKLKLFLLNLDHSVSRLRACLDILRKCSNFLCRDCGEPVTMKRDIVCLAREGSQQAFVNPHGHIHEMITVSRITNYLLQGRSTAEHSWFPGYAWTIIQCKSCHLHMGWRFTATKASLKPASFWGICRASVVPGFQEDLAWLPTS